MSEYSKMSFEIEQYVHVTITVYENLHIDVLPPLVVVFLQFKICMWFPRHMYKDMVLLSIVVFVAIKQ